MIKIYMPKFEPTRLGGGWTFQRNFYEVSKSWAIFTSVEEAEVVLIAGPTQAERDEILKLKEQNKKIVLRVDNIPRNSRNRRTGTTRLKDFADIADLVIYQSNWARDYIKSFIKKDGPVILNSANERIFNKDGPVIKMPGYKPIYLFSQVNRDETKQWHLAWYEYQMIHIKNPKAMLWIMGNFSPEHNEYNWDFFRGENYHYWGMISDVKRLASIYRGADYFMYTYFNDACSNTLIEALLCGVEPIYYSLTGGAIDIKEKWERYGEDYFKLKRMGDEYRKEIERIL